MWTLIIKQIQRKKHKMNILKCKKCNEQPKLTFENNYINLYCQCNKDKPALFCYCENNNMIFDHQKMIIESWNNTQNIVDT